MSRETSAGTGKPYGLERVCRVLEFPRSTIYAQQARESAKVVPLHPAATRPEAEDVGRRPADRHSRRPGGLALHRRGPPQGLGTAAHPARHPRLPRPRAAPDARERPAVAASSAPGRPRNLHDGTITTDRPNEMWGTDGIRIETVDEGWVWVFSAVDHFDACCVGIHAVKTGNRFAALQPIAQGLQTEFGATGADAGRGLTLRMDHGTQYTADDFLNQIKFWGIAPSFAFVAEPQTNGVAERFNRTLKEQAIHGRIFKNVEEVRAAVTAFKDRYNRHWRLEKLGFMSPLEARQAYAMRKAA